MDNIIEQKASRLIKKLRHNGCHVIDAVKTTKKVKINITHPTATMAQRAIEIRQVLHGKRFSTFVLTMDGCVVSWTGGAECSLH
ncbi:hypothetical protein RV032_002105 [Vibrio cholerae]|nr:hypothetical protein [Vibrio cholerae]ELC9567479.1 hypothetical protein [Vibrio cholerae]ELK8282267.1 hypothetical protein [Vibrio cholerae]